MTDRELQIIRDVLRESPRLSISDGDALTYEIFRRVTAPSSPAVVCETCNDTHSMELRGMVVMCTKCPTPCQQCRSGGNGPFCETTPCACKCHVGRMIPKPPPEWREYPREMAERVGKKR